MAEHDGNGSVCREATRSRALFRYKVTNKRAKCKRKIVFFLFDSERQQLRHSQSYGKSAIGNFDGARVTVFSATAVLL